MRCLVVLALVACSDKQGTPLTIDSIDRSCQVDTDCVLTGHLGCCDTTCGADAGAALNAKAWSKASRNVRPRCDEECHVMCAKLPDCRDEAVAVCKAGICDKATRKTTACNDLACETKADCVWFTRGTDCCDQCGGKPLNQQAAERARAAIDATCSSKVVECPAIDCPATSVDCRNSTCVVTR